MPSRPLLLSPASQGEAVDGSDQRLDERAAHQAREAAAVGVQALPTLADRLEVGAGAEDLGVGGGDDSDPEVVVPVRGGEGVSE